MLSHILYIYLGVDDPISYSLGLGPDCNTTCPGDDSEGCGGDRLRFVRFCFFFHLVIFSDIISQSRRAVLFNVFPAPEKVTFEVEADSSVPDNKKIFNFVLCLCLVWISGSF